MKLTVQILAATALAIAGLAVAGVRVAHGENPPPSTGSYIGGVSASGSGVSASQTQVSVSWSFQSDSGALYYDRPCGIYFTTSNSTGPAATSTFGVGEEDGSWSGVVDLAPPIYAVIVASHTPIGVDAHDCSSAAAIGVTAVSVTPYVPPATTTAAAPATTTAAPPATSTSTVTVTVSDPTVDQRLTALEQRQLADEARITELEKQVGAILGEPKNVAPFTNNA